MGCLAVPGAWAGGGPEVQLSSRPPGEKDHGCVCVIKANDPDSQ